MPSQCHPLISVLSSLILVVISFILQLIALTTSWWANYSARSETGKPKEDGHYGLWTLCSTKAPHWKEDCDPLDTFFQVPAYSHVSGVIGVVHLLLLIALLPLELIWAAQIFRNLRNLSINPKWLFGLKVSGALSSTVLAAMVAIFISIGENRQKEYSVAKGWSFWIQVSVVFFDVLISSLFISENIRFQSQTFGQQPDPEGKRAETYGNPTFDADSPDPPRRNYITNGAVAYTETSGHPYGSNVLTNGQSNANTNSSGRAVGGQGEVVSKAKTAKGPSPSLTYENESYQEYSPGTERKKP